MALSVEHMGHMQGAIISVLGGGSEGGERILRESIACGPHMHRLNIRTKL
jgi:hypothetical protein